MRYDRTRYIYMEGRIIAKGCVHAYNQICT